MKILHIIDNMEMGGANSLLFNLAPTQKAAGNDVEILELVKANDQTLTKKLSNAGIDIHSLTTKGSVYNPMLIFKAVKYMRKYDIMHVHLFPALYWVAFAKLISFSKVPLVYTEHSTSNKRRNKPLLLAVDRFVYSNCYKVVIACSDKVQDTYKQMFPNVHTATIPNGVDISVNINAEPYSKKKLLNIEEDSFIITMVARFASMKRQDTIIRAIGRLPERFHAVFVGGDGGHLDEVKKLAKELKIYDRVHFLGVRSDVPRILRSSDVIMMASDYEGLSLSSIEGMAAGKPFIATNVNGLREVVTGAGILFENKDDNELAKIIERLSSDKDLYEQTAKRCEKRAMEFDIKKCADLYLQEYKKYTI